MYGIHCCLILVIRPVCLTGDISQFQLSLRGINDINIQENSFCKGLFFFGYKEFGNSQTGPLYSKIWRS